MGLVDDILSEEEDEKPSLVDEILAEDERQTAGPASLVDSILAEDAPAASAPEKPSPLVDAIVEDDGADDEPGFFGSVADFLTDPVALGAAALRIGGSVAGAAGAGLLAAPTGPGAIAAAAAGGAAGAAAGDVAAQKLEQAAGRREKWNPKLTASEAALGAVPLAKFAKLAGAARVAAQAGQGAAFGAASAASTSLAEKGELPSLGEAAVGAGLGGLIGAGAGKLSDLAEARKANKAAAQASSAKGTVPGAPEQAAAPGAQAPDLADLLKRTRNNPPAELTDEIRAAAAAAGVKIEEGSTVRSVLHDLANKHQKDILRRELGKNREQNASDAAAAKPKAEEPFTSAAVNPDGPFKGTAFKVGDQVWEGTLPGGHAKLMMELEDDAVARVLAEAEKLGDDTVSGFITKDGLFVTKTEAAKRYKDWEAGQSGKLSKILERPTRKLLDAEALADLEKFAAAPEREVPEKLARFLETNLDLADDSGGDLIANVAEALGPALERQRRGMVSDKAAASKAATLLADHFGTSPDKLLGTKAGTAFNVEQTYATLATVKAQSARALNAAKVAGAGSDADKVTALTEFARLGAMVEKAMGVRAEAGRALRAYGAFKSLGPDLANNARVALEKWGDEADVRDLLEKLAKLDPKDTRTAAQLAKKTFTAKWSDYGFEIWVNGLLSGTLTHVANGTSNSLILAQRPAGRLFSAAGDAVKSAATGKQRERFFSEAAYDAWGIMQGFKRGLRPALMAFREEAPNKFENAAELQRQLIPGKAGKLIRFPSRALAFSDALFKSAAESGEMLTRAFRQAHGVEKLRGSALSHRIEELLAGADESWFEAAKQAAEKEAQFRTFTTPLSGKAERAIINASRAIPGARWILPFVRTPINIAKSAMTPSGLVVATGAAMLASEGYITGTGYRDPDKRRADYETGWKPNSIRIGDEYYSYSRIQPLGLILGTAANAVELMDDLDEDSPAKLALAFSRQLADATFLTGLSDLVSAIHDPEIYGDRWIQSLAGTLVPTGIAQVARAQGGEVRQPGSTLEAIKARIPVLENDVPVLRGIFGEVVIRPGTDLERGFSIFDRSPISTDPVRVEMKSLLEQGEDPAPGSPQRALHSQGIKVEFESEEYGRFVEVSGRLAHDSLERVLKLPEYQRLSPAAKAEVFQNAFKQAREAARAQIVVEFPSLNERWRENALKERERFLVGASG